jgi:hypothetical protein
VQNGLQAQVDYVREHRPSLLKFCSCSEGDIIAGFWICFFDKLVGSHQLNLFDKECIPNFFSAARQTYFKRPPDFRALLNGPELQLLNGVARPIENALSINTAVWSLRNAINLHSAHKSDIEKWEIAELALGIVLRSGFATVESNAVKLCQKVLAVPKTLHGPRAAAESAPKRRQSGRARAR